MAVADDGAVTVLKDSLPVLAGEIVDALRAQNVQVAAGTLGQPPYATGGAFQVNVQTQGRLTEPEQFANIIIRTDSSGRQVRDGLRAGRSRAPGRRVVVAGFAGIVWIARQGR